MASDTLQAAFGPGCHVRQQSPLALSDRSEPEPDLVVVRGRRADFGARYPSPADTLLVVEVSDTTLRFDRSQKSAAIFQRVYDAYFGAGRSVYAVAA